MMQSGLNRTTKDQRRAETNGCGMAPIGSHCRELSRACFFSRMVASGRGFGLSWTTSRSNNKPGESAMSVNIIPFQKLESLLLHNLATLKNIYWEPLPFPCLKTIHVTECPELRKLPLDSQSVFRVKEFVIKYKEEEWFERVEWDDEVTRLRFLPFLKFFGPEWQVR
uniref:Uncharacterized protein n=1 Tax=Brassica oleracea var. oleracea TaxID=109376 RepID=A0A0D3DPA2_BRAOL